MFYVCAWPDAFDDTGVVYFGCLRAGNVFKLKLHGIRHDDESNIP